MSISSNYPIMELVLAFILILLMDLAYSLNLDHNDPSLKNNIDYMNIELGSKYTVDSKIIDTIDDRHGMITANDLLLKNTDPVYGSMKNIQEDNINYHGMKTNHDLLAMENTKSEEFQQFMNGSEKQSENGSRKILENSDPLRQIKMGIIKSVKHYIDKIKVNKPLVTLDNIEVSFIKESKILNDNTIYPQNQTNEELDKQLIDVLWRAVYSHRINLGFANSNSSSNDGLFDQFVSHEGRGKKKSGHHKGLMTSVAVAMATAAFLYLKMITMKALFLSLASLMISYSQRQGGGEKAGRQIEAKYQSEAIPASLTAPVCACKCSGERNQLGTGAYKYYNEHKNAYVTLDTNGDEMDHITAGTDYFPHHMSHKSSYLPAVGSL